MLGNMDIQHMPIIPHNPEENGLAERFNLTIMNSVRTALETAEMSWQYWTWALQDATDKYNHFPHRTTNATPQQAWFDTDELHLRNLFIFGQIGFMPVMDKKITKK